MSHLWAVGDKVQVVSKLFSDTLSIGTTKQILSFLDGVTAEVLEVGQFSTTTDTLEYIRLLPLDIAGQPNNKHICFNGGSGVVATFTNVTNLDNAFIPAAAAGPADNRLIMTVVNDSTVPMPKKTVVRRKGVDATSNLTTVDLASAETLLTANPLGMAIEDIAVGARGRVLVQGTTPPLSTVGGTVGAPVWLSDFTGAYSLTPGKVGVVLGQVTSVGIHGNFHLGAGGFFPILFQ